MSESSEIPGSRLSADDILYMKGFYAGLNGRPDVSVLADIVTVANENVPVKTGPLTAHQLIIYAAYGEAVQLTTGSPPTEMPLIYFR